MSARFAKALMLALMLGAGALAAEPRHALLIGNADYQPRRPDLNKLVPLGNPLNDAEAMETLLREYGFTRRVLAPNVLTKGEFKTLVNRFAKGLPRDATVWAYYSGHGSIGLDNKNYLLPTGYNYDSQADVTQHGVSAEWLLQRLLASPARRIILVLDACRDHMPLDASKGPGEESFGNIRVQGVKGKETLIAYASSMGETAWGDRAGDNSLFTGQLLPALKTHAHQPIFLALSDTYGRVVDLSSDPDNRNRFPRVQRPRIDAGMKNWCIAPGGCQSQPPPEPWERIASATNSPPQLLATPQTPSTTPPSRLQSAPTALLIDGMGEQELAQLRRHTAQAFGIPEVYDEELGNGVTIRFHLIPGGQFTMGSPEGKGDDSERPQHKVTLQPFYLAETELTQAQWRAVMDDNPSRFKGDDRPVERVSWNDVQAFLADLPQGKGYRLPSEAEWEYAARAGSTGNYGWGNDKPVCQRGKYNAAKFDDNDQCNDTGTEPVRFSAANAFGLHDMHGNVWEWVQDCWNGNYTGAPEDGSAWQDGNCDRRVLRGGSWGLDPELLRAALRFRLRPEGRLGYIGFRLSRSAP